MGRLFRKLFTAITVSIIITCALLIRNLIVNSNTEQSSALEFKDHDNNTESNWPGFTNEQINKLSKLGEILYLDKDPPKVNTTKNYTFLIWKHGPILERRHMFHYTNKRFDPFEKCSAKNCRITYKDEDIKIANLVVFHLYATKSVQELPKGSRNPQQIWTFLTDESPFHTFIKRINNKLIDYNGLFNWSMSYRMDSDIPVPYGRTMRLKRGEKVEEEDFDTWNNNKKQDVLVAIPGTDCSGENHRWKYVSELQKYIQIDKYGACGTLKCPGYIGKNCEPLLKYKFYLAFENSNCAEYITEKLWWNAYAKNAIPIVMGTSKQLYRQLLPPNSYTLTILHLLRWKKHFKILNEHAYFQTDSIHYCRICEALNYNSKENKVYAKLEDFWSITNDCYPAWDEK